jgi:hypothetical protein
LLAGRASWGDERNASQFEDENHGIYDAINADLVISDVV